MRVITYGTFDLFHEGHRRLLERAKALGDHLIVGVTSESYDDSRGKLNVSQSLLERIRNVQRSGLADEIIVEEYEGQKVADIQRHGVDVFAIGSDWLGAFDYLKTYCEVVYLDRTKGVSSTQLRNESAGGVLKLGIVGAGRIANRLVGEARYVSGLAVEGVYSRRFESARGFADAHELAKAYHDYAGLLDEMDAVYLASPHGSHHDLARQAIDAGVHVLCEKPMTLSRALTAGLFDRAAQRGVVLLEAVKTAFAPGFQRMIAIAGMGEIGVVRSVDATFTKLVEAGREYDPAEGGSISELASYPLMAIVKLLGTDYTDMRTVSLHTPDSPVETFSRIDLRYPHAVASARTGIGVKAEGELIVAGTKGYLYVPAPWWKTEYFELRYENSSANRKYYFRFEGDGLRYELAEFAGLIRNRELESYKLRPSESIAIAGMLERARAEAVRFG